MGQAIKQTIQLWFNRWHYILFREISPLKFSFPSVVIRPTLKIVHFFLGVEKNWFESSICRFFLFICTTNCMSISKKIQKNSFFLHFFLIFVDSFFPVYIYTINTSESYKLSIWRVFKDAFLQIQSLQHLNRNTPCCNKTDLTF